VTQTAPKVVGIIAAGGQGTRLGAVGGKQLLMIAGKPVVAWAIDALAAAGLVQSIVVVCDPNRVEEYAQTISSNVNTEKPLHFVAGGDTREESIVAGLLFAKTADIVAIHDGARPLLDEWCANAAIQALVDGSEEENALDGVVLGNPAVDTLKYVENDCVVDTPDRNLYWHAQTPQIFWRKQLVDAYDKAREKGYRGTDDASYCEHAGGRVRMFAGSRNNIKITTTEDVDFVELLLQKNKKRTHL